MVLIQIPRVWAGGMRRKLSVEWCEIPAVIGTSYDPSSGPSKPLDEYQSALIMMSVRAEQQARTDGRSFRILSASLQSELLSFSEKQRFQVSASLHTDCRASSGVTGIKFCKRDALGNCREMFAFKTSF